MGQNDLKEDGNMDLDYRSFGGLVAQLCPILVTPWTVACQSPLSMGFPRQEYWNRLAFPSLGDLSSPGMELVFTSPALAGRFFTTSTTWWGKEVLFYHIPRRSEVK